MKKCCLLLMIMLLLTGCKENLDYETMSDVYQQTAVMREIILTLPESAAMPVSTGAAGALYICDGYSVSVQTMSGGDLNRTLQATTGYTAEQLQLLQQKQGGLTRYDCAWSCAGEGGELVCRGVILDDGYYHYVLTVLMDAEKAGSLQAQVNAVCASFDASV